MTVAVATVHGNGPYLPVIVFGNRRHVVGTLPFDDMSEALERAISVLQGLRDEMRADLPEGWHW